MEETKRQKQVARLLNEELSLIFQKEGINILPGGGMVSISKVQVTPDLLEARVYLSLFQIKDQKALLADVKARTGEIRHALGQKVRHQLRRVPELQFFTDESIDYAFHMEEVFNKIKADDQAIKEGKQSDSEAAEDQ